MLGRRWLAEPERLRELADEVLAVTQAIQDRAPDRLRQHLERREHGSSMPYSEYAAQGMTSPGYSTSTRRWCRSPAAARRPTSTRTSTLPASTSTPTRSRPST